MVIFDSIASHSRQVVFCQAAPERDGETEAEKELATDVVIDSERIAHHMIRRFLFGLMKQKLTHGTNM